MNDIGLIVADTTRSRFYIQSLVRHNLIPNFVLVLKDKSNGLLPGQINNFNEDDNKIEINHDCWSEINNNPSEPIKVTLNCNSIEFKESETSDLHDPTIIRCIGKRPESIFIYSGFGGVILRKELFDTGKKFLHIHGGYLPAYKGSTTNYYSLIVDNNMGASSIFLNQEIDSGPMLQRKNFPPPKDRTQIDHIYDSAARSKVLIETLFKYKNSGKFKCKKNLEKGETYYIIHPILKHIAILSKD